MEKNPAKIKKAAKKEPPDEDLEIDEDLQTLCREFKSVCEFFGFLIAIYLALKLLSYVIIGFVTFFSSPGTVVTDTTIVQKYKNCSKGVWISSDAKNEIDEDYKFLRNLFRQTCTEKRDGFRYFYYNDLFARIESIPFT